MTSLTPQAVSIVAVVAGLVGLVALGIGVAALRRAKRLEEHYQLLMTGVDGTDLAAALETIARRLGATESAGEAAATRAADTDARLAHAIRHVRTLRYNAYGDSGGDQSFAVALLDDGGDGLVLSTLHGRDGVRIYGKPISGGRSAYTLSAEEERVVNEALGRQS